MCLGTTYIQVDEAILVISGMCVFSTASALFMFPALYLYYKPALDMYTFEKADGVGCAYEIVLQGFIRFASIALGPVIVAVSVIYLLVSSFYAAQGQRELHAHITFTMTEIWGHAASEIQRF